MKDVKGQQLSAQSNASPEEQGCVEPLPKTLTYAAVIDVRNCEQEISDFMVRRACQEMHKLQQFPFAPRK